MIYFIIIGIVLAGLLKRNPLSILSNISLKAPYLLIGGFFAQILLEIETNKLNVQFPIILDLTFVVILVGLYLNRQTYGLKLIMGGTILNFLALVIHGGLMPVSLRALNIAGLEHLINSTDSRHQLMQTSHFWWLGDWIPVFTPIGTNYVLSPGDILVGIGIIVFLIAHSSKRGLSKCVT